MPKTTADAKPSNNRFETSPKEFKKAKKDPFRFQSHPSPFFLFMSDFRVMFMAKNPFNTSVAVVGKAGGQKWKSMSNADKAPYIAMAEKKKEEYELHAYNSKLLKELLGERSFDKSESVVKDEEEDDVRKLPPSPSTSSVDKSSLLPEIRGVQSKPLGPTDNLLHQVQQERIGDTDNADPADDLLSLLTDSSPAASAFSGRSSAAAGIDSSVAMELFKELKRLVSKPLDVASADTFAFNQMRRLVGEFKPLKQQLPLSSQSTLEQIDNFLSLHASKNAFLTATLPVYKQAVNSKDDLVKKLLPLKEQKEKIAVNKKQQETIKVKAEEKVDQLKKQLTLAEAELAKANTGIDVFINLEKKRVDSINALRDEVNQTAKTLRNLQSDYELAVSTKKELEDLLLVITQSSSP